MSEGHEPTANHEGPEVHKDHQEDFVVFVFFVIFVLARRAV